MFARSAAVFLWVVVGNAVVGAPAAGSVALICPADGNRRRDLSVVSLPWYGIGYEVSLTRIPSFEEVEQVIAITGRALRDFFQGLHSNMIGIMTSKISDQLVLNAPYEIVYDTNFEFKPGTPVPSLDELHSELQSAFTGDTKTSYLSLLSGLGPDNIFSQTTDVAYIEVAPAPTSEPTRLPSCACTPSVYTFRHDFLWNCSTNTVKDNRGVLDAQCEVSGLRPEDHVTDLVPIKVSSLEVLELGVNQQVIKSGFYDQGYSDGADISFTSITGRSDALNLTPDQIPRGLQLNIIGQNANGEDILNYWMVLFTNRCNAFPVFEIGDVIGWTSIVGLESPPPYLCPKHKYKMKKTKKAKKAGGRTKSRRKKSVHRRALR